MIHSLPHASVSNHVPRAYDQAHGTIGEVKVLLIGEIFPDAEFINPLIKSSQNARIGSSNGDVVEVPRLFPTFLGIPFPHVGHALLGKVELIARGIMGPQPGKGHVFLTLCNKDIRIALFQPIQHRLDILHLETEVIESRKGSGLPLQQSQAYDAVADMATIGVEVPVSSVIPVVIFFIPRMV